MTTASLFQPHRATDLPPILLVDDEVAILDGLRRQLRRKFAVHTATGGAEALELLTMQPVSVVVSDMRMPQMDGATFLSRVRALQPDVVRILLTSRYQMWMGWGPDLTFFCNDAYRPTLGVKYPWAIVAR